MTKEIIVPHLWFAHQAEEAVKFYTSLFSNSETGTPSRYGKEGFEIHGIPEGTVMTLPFKIEGQSFLSLNGGPFFTPNPSISFFVTCESEAETDRLWNQLSECGQVLMPLDKYDWSPKYGWVQDEFGISWQISYGKIQDVCRKICPVFLFANEQFGRAKEAIDFYTSVFPDSEVDGILKNEKDGSVLHAQFRLSGLVFMIMDSGINHDFNFNEAISHVVFCDSQEEVDYYWSKLSEGGNPDARQCGWLNDKFGVFWQVVPRALPEMLLDKDEDRVKRVTAALLKMKKLDIAELEKAYNGG